MSITDILTDKILYAIGAAMLTLILILGGTTWFLYSSRDGLIKDLEKCTTSYAQLDQHTKDQNDKIDKWQRQADAADKKGYEAVKKSMALADTLRKEIAELKIAKPVPANRCIAAAQAIKEEYYGKR